MRIPLILLITGALANPGPAARAASDAEVRRLFSPLGLVHEPANRRLLLFGQVWASIPGTEEGEGMGPTWRMERLRVLEVGEDGTRTLELPGVFVGLDPTVDPPLFVLKERPLPWTETESSPLWLVDAAHQRILVLAGTRREQRGQWAAHVRGSVSLDDVLDPGKHPERGYAVVIDGPDARIAPRLEPDPVGVAEAQRVSWEADAARNRLVRRTAGVTDLELTAEQLFGKGWPYHIQGPPRCGFGKPSVVHLYPAADGGVWMSCSLQSAIRLSKDGKVLARFWMPREVAARASAGQATAVLWRGNARTPEQAQEAVKALAAARDVLDRLVRLPEGYPKVVRSDTIPGLRPGFHAVLLGVCPTPEAERILKLLQAVDPEIYGRRVRAPADACPQVDHGWTLEGPHDGIRGKPARLRVAILRDEALHERSFTVVSLRSRSGKVLQRTAIASDTCATSSFSVDGLGRDWHVVGVLGFCQDGCTLREASWSIDGEDAIRVTRSLGAEFGTVADCK